MSDASAAVGFVAWLGVTLAARQGLWGLGVIEILVLLPALVLVPLALPLIVAPAAADSRSARLLSAARWLQPLGAAAAVASFTRPRGVVPGLLAATWLAVTGLLALHGLSRLRSFGLGSPADAVLTAGLCYVSLGGGWLVLSRLGVGLGFEEPTVLLTAVHFHYAGFVAPMLVGRAAAWIVPRGASASAHRVAALGTIAGPPLTAAGITLSPAVELLGAVVLAAALATFGVLLLAVLRRRLPSRLARVLVTVAGASLLAGMLLALGYACGEFTGASLVSLARMARTHGPVNALGFGLCGLLGFRLAQAAGR